MVCGDDRAVVTPTRQNDAPIESAGISGSGPEMVSQAVLPPIGWSQVLRRFVALNTNSTDSIQASPSLSGSEDCHPIEASSRVYRFW